VGRKPAPLLPPGFGTEEALKRAKADPAYWAHSEAKPSEAAE
jgi:hypothetical protein